MVLARKRQLESTTNEQQLRVAVTSGPLKVVLIPPLSTVSPFTIHSPMPILMFYSPIHYWKIFHFL